MPKKISHNWVSVSYLLMYKILRIRMVSLMTLESIIENRSVNQLPLQKHMQVKK